MKTTLAAAGAMLLSVATTALAHEVDEYVQATTIAVEKGRVRLEMRLLPGIDVYPAVRAAIDADGDGAFSEAEQRAYVERVLRDLSLGVDGAPLALRLVGSTFASTEELRRGRGEIVLDFEARIPPGGGDRRLTFENHHLSQVAAYLVNALVPSDPDISITRQTRSYDQSSYRLDYAQAGAAPAPVSTAGWSGTPEWLGAAALLALLAPLALRRRWGERRTT